jgi:hypothetical protein
VLTGNVTYDLEKHAACIFREVGEEKAAGRICYISKGKRRSDDSGIGNNDGGKMKSSDSISQLSIILSTARTHPHYLENRNTSTAGNLGYDILTTQLINLGSDILTTQLINLESDILTTQLIKIYMQLNVNKPIQAYKT